MATSAAVISAIVAVKGYSDQQKAQKDARKQAEQQQQALEALKREEAPTMATPDSDAVARARRRSIAGQLGRRGRASTILTSDTGTGDSLGA